MPTVKELLNACSRHEIYRLSPTTNLPIHVPVTLAPSPFPEHHFHEMLQSMKTFNLLVDELAGRKEFLELIEEELECSDDFMQNLFRVHKETVQSPWKCNVVVGLNRNDFLLDKRNGRMFQVELNTFSCSFMGLSEKVSMVLRELYPAGNVPKNESIEETFSLFLCAFTEYFEDKGWEDEKVLLMLVHPQERNIYDQQFLTEMLREKAGIHVIRKTFQEIIQDGYKVDANNGDFFVGSRRISGVYYRTGYVPEDYSDDESWNVRIAIEKSRCIKFPNVAYQIIGKKVVQLLLKNTAVFTRFLPDAEFSTVPQVYTGLYSLSDTRVVNDALKHPEKYVLKPQRDGGGHNLYGDDIVQALSNPRLHKKAYVLMDLIEGVIVQNTLVTSVDKYYTPAMGCISELGIYGGFVKVSQQCSQGQNQFEVKFNKSLGYLLRTKDQESNESGVAAGFGYLDAPSLY